MKNTWLITVGLVAAIFIGFAYVGYQMISDNESKKEEKKKAPKILAPSNIIDKTLVAPNLIKSTTAKPVGDFKFIDQEGDSIDQSIVNDKIFVVDYFFTTCKGICPAMSDQMSRVHEKFKHRDDFVILSHTVWPEVDSVETMKAYADEHNATPKKWLFLTGDKKELYKLARNSYFVLKPAAVKGGGDGNSDFIHTNLFVLVDKNRHIRGYYKGTDPEQVDKLIETIDYLLEN